ncbi:MAG TPA: glycosyltransferase family 1 protein [Trichocoleus sp.]
MIEILEEFAAPIIANFSFVGSKPTGLATYALNLSPELHLPGLALLVPPAFQQQNQLQHPCVNIPGNLSSEQGKLGHFRRLRWTQLELPKLYRKLQSNLLFSLVPEAPLWAGCRSVVMVHDLIPLRFPRWTSPLTQYARFYVPQVLNQAEHIICNSKATAEDICQFYQIPARKITPISLAHDSRHFRVPESDRLPPPDRPYFLYVGRHDPYKNLQRLIRAFAALPNCSSYELWIAGSADPRYTPMLKALALELDIPEQVKFLDYVRYEDLPILLNRSIAMVYPSLWEGFGFPVLEAMACGAPVITSNLSSMPEVAGEAALLVNPYNEAEITAAMYRIATDSQMQAQLRAAGLQQAKQFSWAKTGQATAEVLQQFV